MWDIMSSHDPLVIDQNLRWLGEVEPKARRRLCARLHGNIDDYRSARIELFLHHVFHERGYDIDWEPPLSGTGHVTEFRASSENSTILVEAKVSGVERAIQEHWDINGPLLDRFEALLLPSVLTFGFVATPPPLFRLEEVWCKVKDAVTKAEFHRAPDGDWHSTVPLKIAASEYVFDFTLMPSGGNEPDDRGLVIPMTPALMIDPAQKLYHDIEYKATRYGKLQESLLIVDWGSPVGGERSEHATLYGTPNWVCTHQGWKETRLSDGLFNTSTAESEPRYPQISAVAFFRSSSSGGAVKDSLVVYHNPLAAFPLKSSVLADFPQYWGTDTS